jgi:iron complex outermembrane recepter protein
MKQLSSLCLLLAICANLLAQTTDSLPRKTDTGFNRQQTLGAVTISAQKPFIENRVDKTVLNIDSRPTAAGQNALELLAQAPGVVVDGNDNISISGKSGVNIYIDGRPTQLSGADVARLLKSIDAGNVKQVEIITNPSARFDAAGNAGIINFKLKKSLSNGFNGNLSAGMQQSDHARQNTSANLNLRQNKWNLFGNGSYSRGYQITTANNDRESNGLLYTQRGDEKDRFWDVAARAGADYTIDTKNIIGVLWMYNQHSTEMDNNNRTLLQRTGAADTNVFARSFAPFKTRRNNLNLNYAYKGKANELNVDVDFARHRAGLDNLLQTGFTTAALVKYAGFQTRNQVAVVIDIYSAKVDFTRQLKGINGKWEAGAKLAQTQTNNDLRVSNEAPGGWRYDTGKTNRFDFTERVAAAYTSVEGKFGKLSVQAGLRAEQTLVNGVSTDLKGNRINRPDTAYLNLFPTLFVQYAMAKHHQLGLSFGRRIDRPSYQDQNPFIYALDAFNSERGNPFLLPQLSYTAELNYTYKDAASLKLKYAVTQNLFEQVTFQEGSNTIMIPQNVGQRRMFNISLSSPLPLAKWWNGYIQVEPFYQGTKGRLTGFGNNNVFNTGSWGFNGYIGNWITIKGGYTLEASAWFNYQNQSTIYRSKPIGSINIGVQKNIFANRATLKLRISDVLNNQRWAQTVNNGSLRMSTYRKWESRNIGMNFSYRFGKQSVKAARQRGLGNEAETGRIK